MIRNVCCLLLLLACAHSLRAQLLQGTISAQDGTPLPFAAVYLEGTTTGSTANASGQYQLQLPAGRHRIVCRYMGYAQSVAGLELAAGQTLIHHFRLQPQSLEMQEVLVRATDEDPAYRIMRQVIARRAANQKALEAFQSGIYLKGALRLRDLPAQLMGREIKPADMGLDSSGRGVVYLCEQMADYFQDKSGANRTIIRSVTESGNPGGFGMARLPAVISFYDNTIRPFSNINPRGFISPLSDQALNYYRYRLLGHFTEGDELIYKIDVQPRRAYEPLFEGTLYVVHGNWSVHSLDMLLHQRRGLDMLDSLRIEQLHLPLPGGQRVIKKQVIYVALKVLGFDITGHFATVYDRQKLGLPIPDSLMDARIISRYDAGAHQKDSSYWTASRPIPLLEDEQRDYQVKDSLRRVETSPAYVDSVRKAGNRIRPANILYAGLRYRGPDYRLDLRTNGLLTLVNFNTVEGWNVAPKLWYSYRPDSLRRLSGKLATRYGFSNERFHAIGSLYYTRQARHWRGRDRTLGLTAGRYVFQFDPAAPISPLLNTISSVFYHQNHMKLYERWELGLHMRRRLGNGFAWQAGLSLQDRRPLENTTGFTLASEGRGGYTENMPEGLKQFSWEAHRALLANLKLSYQPGVRYIDYPDHRQPLSSVWPVFELAYTRGIAGVLESRSDFDKWRFTVSDDMRIGMAGMLSYRLSAGGFLQSRYVSLPDLMHPQGNELKVAAPFLQSFQLMPYYSYSNREPHYGELHMEHQLLGLLSNKIPLLRQAQWYLVWGNNSFYAGPQNWYTELFAGIDNIGWGMLRMLRFDYVHAWDAQGGQRSGIRLGLRLSQVLMPEEPPGQEW